MKNLTTQGFVLLDVDAVALNNAGKATDSHFDNAVATKKIRKNNRSYPYISGQAWRYWWRDALQKNLGWEVSPVIREDKVAHTAANPILHPDDDMFGYMKAAKEGIVDEDGKPVKDKKGNQKTENITVTRVSPLKNSVLVSVAPTEIQHNWSSMARQEGDSVPYGKDEYSAIMKGMFSIALEQAGTFSSYNKTGFKNLSDGLKLEALKSGAEEIDDPFVKNKSGNPMKLVRLPKEIRQKRVTDTLKALKTIQGGAMQTNNMADVKPKFIVLATLNSANHPFSHIAVAQRGGIASLSMDALKEVLREYDFIGNVYIGKRSGFMDELNEELEELAASHENVKYMPVNQAIDAYCEEVANYL